MMSLFAKNVCVTAMMMSSALNYSFQTIWFSHAKFGTTMAFSLGARSEALLHLKYVPLARIE